VDKDGNTMDRSGANLAALEAINADRETPIKSASPNISTTSSSRTIERSSDAPAPCGFKNFRCARVLLSGIECMHMIAKGQMKCARGTHPFAADQFYELAT
jgi:putative transposase